jgi:uncharacterized membrane protein YqiK
MSAINSLLLTIGVSVGGILVLGLIIARLYHRASKEISFVRTGFGGQKVVLNGGALVLPVLHEVIPVNMNTLRLEVQRANEQALITRDRMRVDVQAEFYVRVKPTEEAIADAAQTLGRKTLNPGELKTLVEGKFVDALRSVAASMTMEELHEQRTDFVQRVQQAVSEDLLKNGLELEAVSLTGLDQTSREYFNPNNAFDAQGLTKLTEEIEARRKQRNDIEQDTNVAVQQKNLEAEKQRLQLSREQEYARLEQEREISIRKAAQVSEIAKTNALKEQEAKQAEILSKQKIETSTVDAQRTVRETQIETERLLKEREIGKQRAIDMAEVERVKLIELAKQDQAIAIAEKSKAQSESQADADKAKALAVQAEEEVSTVRETERAERQKKIELIEAAKQAQREALSITIAAQADKEAAENKAAALKILASGDAEKERISAQGEADATKLRAEADALRYKVDSDGQRTLNEAANTLSTDQIALRIKLALLEALPSIIERSVKPMEQIDSIKIFQIDGLNGATQGRSDAQDGTHQSSQGGTPGTGNLADQVVTSALRYRAQAPLVESLMKEVGLSGGASLNQLTESLGQIDRS